MFRITFILAFCPFFVFAESHLSGINEKFERAIKSYEDKKYIEAVTIFSDLAEQGFAEAQFNLSLLYFSGLGTPKNFKWSLYWAWRAHLNKHKNAQQRVEMVIGQVDENLTNSVADLIVSELLDVANQGNKDAALHLGQTYLGLFVVPNFEEAYVWLSISQAFGDAEANTFLLEATSQLDIGVILQKQEEAQELFQNILANS